MLLLATKAHVEPSPNVEEAKTGQYSENLTGDYWLNPPKCALFRADLSHYNVDNVSL